MGRVAFAEMARIKREGMSLRSFYLNVVEMTTALLWPTFAGLAVLSYPLIRLVYGARWIEAAGPFALLSISALILSAVTMTWEVFVACGETAKQAKFEFFRTGMGTIFFAIGCSISLEAAAAARIADALLTIILYRPHVERMTDTTLRDTGPIYLRSGLLTAMAVGPAAILTRVTPTTAISSGQISVAIFAGVGLWISALVFLRHPLFNEAFSILKRRMIS